MSKDELVKKVYKLIQETPRNEWGQELEGLSGPDLNELSDIACSLSVVAAEVSEYVGQRGGYGCGDHGEEAAKKAVERKRKRVRKALGYSYP